MFSTIAMAEFADKYADHIVLSASAGTGTALSEIWHVIPVEIAALTAAALFLAARVCVERWIHTRHDRKVRQLRQLRGRHPHKRRLRV